MKLYDVTNYESSNTMSEKDVQNTLVGAKLNDTRVDSLFNRPVVYLVSAAGLMDTKSAQYRLTGMGMASMTLVKTKNSTLTVGIMAFYDPSIPVPAIPFISYYHKFNSPGLEFFLDPSRIALRKEMNSRNSLAIVNNFGGNLAFFKIDAQNLPAQHTFSTFEIKSGLTYEYLIAPKIVFNLSAGANATATSKKPTCQSISKQRCLRCYGRYSGKRID